MRTVFLLTTFLFVFTLLVYAQKKCQPAFGKIDKADLEMKDCDFDKVADALILIDYKGTP